MSTATADIAPREGYATSRRYTITPAVYESFVAASGDTNPMHMQDDFARQHGLPERVMHGTILNAFISHFVGMHYPGGAVLLHSVNAQYKSPSHLGDDIEIAATVTQVVESVRVLTMDLVLTNVTRGRVAAKAKVQVGWL